MKIVIKQFIPNNLINQYHKVLALLANIIYGQPSEKMIIIGVTGTNGKSSTVELIARILDEAGYKTGFASTVGFKVADNEWLNDKKMTMLGRFQLQKLLSQMMKADCQYAVIETSSQGIEQSRHLGINYDVAVFTNLTPEHIEAHGGFENYKEAKQKLFAKLKSETKKKDVPKIIIANTDDKHAQDFLKFEVDKKFGFGLKDKSEVVDYVRAENIEYQKNGTAFKVMGEDFNLKLFGQFNVYNSLSAITVALSQGVDLAVAKKALERIKGVPGRMELIDEGPTSPAGKQDFKVVVDYAPEPESLKQAYQTIKDHKMTDGKVIHVLGSCGGGRDLARQPILGKTASDFADYVIVTNEDPYDDNPMEIINNVAKGAEQGGKVEGKNLFKIEDRREAIKKAISLAQKGDLVLLTGKGSEQAICVAGGKKIKWDEREVARKLLKNR